MSWALGYDSNWDRDVGYGVPATCDHPKCQSKIHRGLSYVCGGEPFGGDDGCGLYFCTDHLRHRTKRDGELVQNCPRCMKYKPPYRAKPDHPEWTDWKLTDESWADWRFANPEAVAGLSALKETDNAG